MFLPGEGGSDDKIDGSTVLPSNPPLRGKALMYQQYLVSKQKQEEEKKKQEKKNKRQKTKNNKRKIKKYVFLLQRQDWKSSIYSQQPMSLS